ncbi:hypothetical protein F4677DRAFT_409840 [Hypoxylon crocopeplum]|nr:hypothetical protein F4677DRAFT_409840 [Hypoxylon crocopeplum]
MDNRSTDSTVQSLLRHIDQPPEEEIQQPPSKSARKRKRIPLAMSRQWISEILALILSTACILAIGILLIIYHGRPVESFPQGITLNAVTSVLSTTFKAALIYTVSSALGQSKWNWYTEKQGRRLRDFERIDDATRGPLGALCVLHRPPVYFSTSVGAIVIVLALLVDPFAQQLIGSTVAPVLIESDAVWTELLTNIFTIPPKTGEIQAEDAIRTSLNGAIWNDASFYDRKANCPNGNCTFPAFKTLDWCVKSETIDVSRVTTNCSLDTYDPADFTTIFQLRNQTEEKIIEYRPCGLFLDNDPTPLTVFSMDFRLDDPLDDYPGEPLNYTEFPYEFVNVDHGWSYYTDDKCGSWLGIRCPPLTFSYVRRGTFNYTLEWMEQSVLTLCTTEYNVTVDSGSTNAVPTKSEYGSFMFNMTAIDNHPPSIGGICFTSDYDGDGFPTFPNDTNTERPVQGNDSSISFCWRATDMNSNVTSGGDWAWASWLSSIGPIIAHNMTTFIGWNQGEMQAMGETGDSPFEYGSQVFWMMERKGLDGIMRGITASMNHAWHAMSEERVTGSFEQMEVRFQIQWEWLLLLIVLDILGHVVLISVMYTSKKTGQQELWKGSALATLYHGMDDDSISKDVGTTAEMEEAADMTIVKLNFTEKAGRIMLTS